MRTITFREAKQRSCLDLKGDWELPFYDEYRGRMETVSEGQRRMEWRYPLHREIRLCGMEFFSRRGYEIYPRGLTVNGIGTCPDFAFFRRSKITFVECLTIGWTDIFTLRKKRRLAKYGNLVFLVEHPAHAKIKNWERKRVFTRLVNISKRHPVYLYHPQARTLTRLTQ